ncbi:monofunctional biosynthetic peptidoglycan transglycosylase [bacterium]|nr:monofunctional biosynthetic peptidoglycan transglycosylase [bacterium]
MRRIRKVKRILQWIVGLCMFFILYVGLLWIFGPDVAEFRNRNPGTTALMEYREARYRKTTGKRQVRRQQWVPLSTISPKLIHAVLIAEDDNFYRHEGFDFHGMEEAMKENLEKGRLVRGGSTITQQLAKNLYLSPKRSPDRKIREAILAFELDRKLKKRRILELYLNVIEWGEGIYGIEAASKYYYHKPASSLTAEQAVRLASVLPNPMRYHPDNDRSKRMRNKRRIVAKLLVKRKLMTQAEYNRLNADLRKAGK